MDKMMFMTRSVSQPSLGTTATFPQSIQTKNIPGLTQTYRGQRFWEGRLGVITRTLILLPWSPRWQLLIILIVVFKYCAHFLLGYELLVHNSVLDTALYVSETVFYVDVALSLLHQFWPILRVHVRVFRRYWILMAFDVVSLLPVHILGYFLDMEEIILVGRWLKIGRIYRLIGYFYNTNNTMRTGRVRLYFLEQLIMVALSLHGCTCAWYGMHREPRMEHWYKLGFPDFLSQQKLKFDTYAKCWYYCSCRMFNCIFGDCYPITPTQKLFTTFVMLFGFVFVNFRFVGFLAWELILQSRRWANYLEQYHLVMNYLKLHNAPQSLMDQSQQYKEHIWSKKSGIRDTALLRKFPLPLQMELIFDINVGPLHDSLLLRDTGVAFMRHISLLVRHELYMAGQHVWSQGVVKGGLVCVRSGVLELLSEEDDESPVIAFKEGTVLGEVSLFYSIPSKVTVKAATYVELQVLRRTDFMPAMAEYPQTLETIREQVKTRIATSKRKEEDIQKYEKSDLRLLRTRYRPMKTLKDHLNNVEEEDTAFTDDSHMYYRDENNKRQTKFTTDYLGLYKITENVSAIDTPRICLRGTFPWIIEPDTSLTYIIDVGHFVTVLHVCVTSALAAVDYVRADWQVVFDWIVYAVLLFQLYVQLTTAIVKKNSRLETVKEIVHEKMGSLGFYVDVVSVFPFFIFTSTLDPENDWNLMRIATVLPALQAWHLWDYFDRWQEIFDKHVKILSFLKFSLMFCLSCHWAGCFLYLIACPKHVCLEKSWFATIILWETKMQVSNDPKHERPLHTALLFGTLTFTASGGPDIPPGKKDFLVVVVILAIGASLACYYAATICSIYFLAAKRKTAFKESMRELFYFLTVNRVSSKIKRRVENFFCVQWYYNEAVSSDEIIKCMSPSIQREIRSIDRIETLLLCPLFQDCSRDFLQTVATNSRAVILPKKEIVQHACDIRRDMYIIKMGHCNKFDHTGEVLSILGPGDVIGAIEMLYGLPKVHTVKTITNCILIHVEYSALGQSWSLFPNIRQPIVDVLDDPEIRKRAMVYEIGKPLVGHVDAKRNRIAREIKESIIFISAREFLAPFESLGLLGYLRYLFVPVCFTPHGLFLKCWCFVRLCVSLYYVAVLPYTIATKQWHYQFHYHWMDFFLYADLPVMAYVGYYDERSLLVSHPLLTFIYYVQHGFLLDLVSVFPIEEFCKIVIEHGDTDVFRVNRILLILRLIGALSYWEEDILAQSQVLLLMKFMPLALVIVNVATAVIVANSCTPYDMVGSLLRINCTRGLEVAHSDQPAGLTYALMEYIRTLSWIFEMFVGCGCSFMSAASRYDSNVILAVQLIGVLFVAYMFGYITATRSAASVALLEHNEKTKDLENFLYQENVDPALTAKTLNYFKYVWKRTHGSDPQKICRLLNSALMEDTLVFMYEKALREVPLFGKVERSFIRVVTQHLREIYFLKGETVVQCKDIQKYIYIIYRGKVDVLSSYNEMLTCMGPGGMFGNFTGKPISCSEVAIYASRSLDLLMIPSQTFFNVIKYYPKVQELMNKALETSGDYILPITMDDYNESSEDEMNPASEDSEFECKSSTSTFITGSIGISQSRSNISQAKSFASALSYNNLDIVNLKRPGSKMYQIQGYITCVMATLNYVTVSYEIVTLNDCFILFWIQALIDLFFYVRLYLLMHEGYLNKHGDLVLDRTRCRRRYFHHRLWLYADLLANVPLELFGLLFTDSLYAMHFFRANKLLRLKYLLQFYRASAKELTNNLTVLQTVTTALVMVMAVHTLASMWLLALISSNPMCLIRPAKMHLVDADTPNRLWDYTTSLYVVVAELTTTGGDEYDVKSIFSLIILALCLIFGRILAAIVVSMAMQISHFTKYALNVYEKETLEVIDYLNNQGLSKYQYDKFWKYIQQLWVTERGRQLPDLIPMIPYVLRCDVMSALFGRHLRACYLFSDTSQHFLRQLSVLLEYNIFFPGNYIVVAGDSDPRMYWVASGVVSVVSVRSDLTETTHEQLRSGDLFGVIQGLNRGIPHHFSYRADTQVGIISLSSDTWMNILPYFPEATALIKLRSEILFTKI